MILREDDFLSVVSVPRVILSFIFSFVSCGSLISYTELALPSLICCMNCMKYFILLFYLFLARSRQVFRGS